MNKENQKKTEINVIKNKRRRKNKRNKKEKEEITVID